MACWCIFLPAVCTLGVYYYSRLPNGVCFHSPGLILDGNVCNIFCRINHFPILADLSRWDLHFSVIIYLLQFLALWMQVENRITVILQTSYKQVQKVEIQL